MLFSLDCAYFLFHDIDIYTYIFFKNCILVLLPLLDIILSFFGDSKYIESLFLFVYLIFIPTLSIEI